MRDGEMRVSDAERRAVAEALSTHYADGRLDETELNERLDAAMGAKTRDDLAPLLVDLPRLGGPEPARASRPPRRFAHLFVLLVAMIFALSAATAFVRPHVPWLLIGIVALIVLRRGRHTHHVHLDRDDGVPMSYRRRLFGSW